MLHCNFPRFCWSICGSPSWSSLNLQLPLMLCVVGHTVHRIVHSFGRKYHFSVVISMELYSINGGDLLITAMTRAITRSWLRTQSLFLPVIGSTSNDRHVLYHWAEAWSQSSLHLGPFGVSAKDQHCTGSNNVRDLGHYQTGTLWSRTCCLTSHHSPRQTSASSRNHSALWAFWCSSSKARHCRMHGRETQKASMCQ